MLINVTSLAEYLYCSRKLFLRNVLLVEEAPKEVMLMGTIRHETFDRINKIEENVVSNIKKSTDQQEIQKLYFDNYCSMLRKSIINNKDGLKYFNLDLFETYKKILPSFSCEARVRANNVHSFMIKNNVFGEELWEKLTPKIKSELRMSSEKLMLKGIIDKVEVWGEHHVPFELKTGKAPNDGMWPGHRIQIGAYILLLEEKFKTHRRGFIHYLDIDDKRELTMNPFLEDEIKTTTISVKDLLSGNELPEFCGNDNKCATCGLKEKCFDKNLINDKLTRL